MSLVPKAEINPSPEPHDQLVSQVASLWHNPMVVQLPGLPSSSSNTDPASTGSASTSEGNGMPQDSPGSSHSNNDLSGDAEGVWAPDIDQAFHEALQIYPPCGRRKIILSDEGKMYGRNELIARYIKIRCGKTRTRKQVSSHIQVLARKKNRELTSKIKGQNLDPKQAMDETSPQQSAQKPASISLTTTTNLYPGINSTSSQSQSNTNGASRANNNLLEHPKPLKIETGNLPDTGAKIASVLGQAAVAASCIGIGHATAGMPQAAMAPTWPYNPHALQSMFPPYYTSLPEEALYQQVLSMANIVSSANAAQLPLINGKSHTIHHLTEDRTIASSKLTLCGFIAYVQGPGEEAKTDLLRIPKVSEEPMENVPITLISDKYPPELLDLFNKGPLDAFFLVKCWANVAFSIPNDERTAMYAVDSFYETPYNFDISVSTKVCSFGKQVVEKVEIYSPIEENSATPLYHFKVENSPMCDYMVRFIAELKKLGDQEGPDMMNNVLNNFTILQIVKNKDSDETLMVIALVIEVSPEPESSCRIYRLVN